MEFETLRAAADTFLQNCPENYVPPEDALRPDLAGMRIFDAPLLGAAAAEDPLFRQLQTPGVVDPNTLLPTDWLAEAQSVLAFFLPFTEAVRHSNRQSADTASEEWLHARIEGQIMVDRLGAFLCELLQREGFAAVYPAADERFAMVSPFASNWSERHVAYICGLGTFGISRGLITSRGIAGRFGSVITSASIPATGRAYSSPFEYCTMCGKCQKNCPAQAIDTKRGVIHGKDQDRCSAFVDASYLPPHGPNQRIRFGCGKCQVGVPCEARIPRSKPR